MQKRIKILFTIPNFDTAGSGSVLLNIAKGLEPSKFEPHIMCFHEKGKFFQKVVDSNIPIHIFKFTKEFEFTPGWFKHCWRVSREFRKINPDIIHSFHYASEFSEAFAAFLAGKKWIYTKKNMAWGNKAWHIRSFLAHRIIATNQKIKTSFFHDSPKVSVIYSGVDTALFQYDFKAGEQKNFIVVGNVSEIKGSKFIVEAFLKYAEHHEGHLFFVGPDESEYALTLKKNINGLRFAERIIFTGKIDNIQPYLKKAFCLIMGSDQKGEGGPLALLEAMATGLPVIGSRVPGIEEQLCNFPQLLFAPNNSEELYQKMLIISAMHKNDINRLSRSLRLEVEKRFSLRKEILEHQRFYSSIMKRIN